MSTLETNLSIFWREAVLRSHLSLIIVVTAGLNVAFIGGVRRCFSVFIARLHDANTTRPETGEGQLDWIGDSYASMCYLLLPVATTVVLYSSRSYRVSMLTAMVFLFFGTVSSSLVPGPSVLFITHSLFTSVGSALTLGVCTLVVGEFYNSKHQHFVLATSVLSGGPLGALIFCPIFSAVTQQHGWRITFRVISLVFFFLCLLGAAAFRTRNTEEVEDYQDLDNFQLEADEPSIGSSTTSSSTYQRSTPSPITLLESAPLLTTRQMTFIRLSDLRSRPQTGLWLLERCLHSLIMYSLAMNLMDYLQDRVIRSGSQSEPLLSASKIQFTYTAGESVIYITCSLLGDKMRNRMLLMYVFRSCALLCLMITWHFLQGYTALELFLAFMSGASIGIGNSFVYALSEDVTSLHGSTSFPMTHMASGLGILFAPLASGTVIDSSGYTTFFATQACLSGVSLLVIAAVFILQERSFKTSQRLSHPTQSHQNEQVNEDSINTISRTTSDEDIIEAIKRNR